MKAKIHHWLGQAKRRIQQRLRPKQWAEQPRPMLAAGNICYEACERTSGLAAGGIGAMHLLAQQSGLVRLIDTHLHLLRRHLPYHESDHVLNLAYNVLAGGSRIEHLELRRNDEVYLDALGAERIPDPTTAGDFCRRFQPSDVERLLECINAARLPGTRLRVRRRQPKAFFREAVIDGDGTIAATAGECKQGMQLAYNGQWGYQRQTADRGGEGLRGPPSAARGRGDGLLPPDGLREKLPPGGVAENDRRRAPAAAAV